ncbi:hypothetical protein WDJ51_02555 [Rathayibacter sp. YIM 133350]|uniref:hypothetical protein n=1 Tax=Rathayibacter sp. YIM 133350 TaxID=3131992 RepID=UPI00307DCD26
MGIWFPAVSMSAGERVLYKSAANSLRGWRTIGGQIIVTDRRLIFVPNRLDAMTGASRREIPLLGIHRVSIHAPSAEGVNRWGLAASIRPRLEITDSTDSPLVVAVANPDGLYSLLPH